MDSIIEYVGLSGAVTKKAPDLSGDTGSSFADFWKKHKKPDKLKLIEQNKRIAFACANLNAEAIGQVPLKLYVQTRKGERKPKCYTKSIDSSRVDYLVKEKLLYDAINVEEVIEHPVLDLLRKVNSHPGFFYYSLMVLTQLYQDITGKSYWHIIDDPVLNIPDEIWLIPTQFIEPKKKENAERLIDYYEFKNGINEKKYKPEEIIPFLLPSLHNPYLDGIGALQASWEANRVSDKLIAHEDNFLENEARPDIMLSPGKDNSIGADEAKAIELRFAKKFGFGNSGKLFVNEEEMEVTPLNYSPRDLARLEIHKWSKVEICNAFAVPVSLLETTNVNRAILEAAREQHALNAIKPRCTRMQGIFDEELLTRYDETRRLFFCFDDPVPENKEMKLKENTELKKNRIVTANEVRKNYGYPPIAGGDKLDEPKLEKAGNSSGSNKS